MKAILSSGIIAGAAAGLLALALPASAQTPTAPTPNECSTGSAASGMPCQNRLQQPGQINNNGQTPTMMTPPPMPGAVGPQGGSGVGTGTGTGGSSVGGSGMSAPSSSGGGVGGGTGGSGSSGGGL
ncbi:MAG TPA: hypothetical protein VMT54_00555 [Candidatus Cybelea sp.]|nr:hypothetical protein [Candidatus Cybelea sp.]